MYRAFSLGLGQVVLKFIKHRIHRRVLYSIMIFLSRSWLAGSSAPQPSFARAGRTQSLFIISPVRGGSQRKCLLHSARHICFSASLFGEGTVQSPGSATHLPLWWFVSAIGESGKQMRLCEIETKFMEEQRDFAFICTWFEAYAHIFRAPASF